VVEERKNEREKFMPLDEYRKKRDFVQSPEPKGEIKIISKEEIKENEERKVDTKPIFVVQEHHATRLHYDLRLEMEGVLKSWAIPKGPPEEFGVRRLAIQTEDHPIEYADFEGQIPEGMYGAGKVITWDRGEFILEEKTDSKLVFHLKGKRLIGKYALIKIMLRGKESWLLFKVMEF
jgi:DNA ligase D-like protein (predicted 3'-phosphoesterase)